MSFPHLILVGWKPFSQKYDKYKTPMLQLMIEDHQERLSLQPFQAVCHLQKDGKLRGKVL